MDNKTKIKDLDIYNENDKQKWRDTQNELKIHNEKKDELRYFIDFFQVKWKELN